MQDNFSALTAIINERYSCRAYLKKQVADQDIKDIVELACRAPTWCNAQPWGLIVTKGQETKRFGKMLSKTATSQKMEPDFVWPTQYSGAFQERRRECGYQLYEALGIAKDDHEKRDSQMMANFRFFDAPHVAIITTEAELGPYGAMDTAGFISLFTIAAKAKGVDTVAQASVTGFAPAVRKYFDIPNNRLIQTAIAFGYGKFDHPANSFRTNKAVLSDVLRIIK